jgi:hypothetical protein
MSKKFTSRIPWRSKLEDSSHSKIVDVPPSMTKRLGGGTMLIPKPLDIDALIRKVKKGKLVTASAIRSKLARDNSVDVTCPLTTGIFIRIVAEAAEDDLHNGAKRVTPYWRVVRDDGSLIGKFPGGVSAQSRHLREEGHTLEPARGKRAPRVKNLDKHLTRFE